MKCLITLLLLLFFIATGIPLPAQQPVTRFHNLTTKDGLSGDVVYYLHQDKQSFIGLGAHRGLNRCDGYCFSSYNYSPLGSNSLWSNQVYSIAEDIHGILWLITNKGWNSMMPGNGKLTRYSLPDAFMPAAISN